MFDIHLSNFNPEGTFKTLAGFVPGFFFVFSVLLGDPGLAERLAANTSILTRGPYLMAGVVLILSFVIGNGFMLVDTFIRYFFAKLYGVKILLCRLICKWPLQQVMQWALTKPRWNGPWLDARYKRIRTIAVSGFEADCKVAWACWRLLARRLLEVKYGVDPGQLNEEEWRSLHWNLETFTPTEIRGSILMLACHAAGWAGLTATRFAPALRDNYYIGFCLFLILSGFLNAYYLTVPQRDPRLTGGFAVRALLREFPKAEAPRSEAQR